MSPDLFSLYSLTVIAELEELEGISTGGKNINIRYADNTLLIADTEDKLRRIVEVLNIECKRYGLKINIAKTEVMRLSKRVGQLPVKISLENKVEPDGEFQVSEKYGV